MTIVTRPLVAQQAGDLADEDLEALGEVVEGALRGHKLECAGRHDLSPTCCSLLDTISAIVTSDESLWPELLSNLTPIATECGAEVLSASQILDHGLALRQRSNVALVQPDGDKPLVEHGSGVYFDVAAGERSRLWIQLTERSDCWLHLLVQPVFDPGIEPVVALRYLHYNDNEEVAVRFRRSGIVLHKEIELPLQAGRPVFLSLGIVDGEIHICINGIPAYRRRARHPYATSFMLDAIGVSAGPTRMLIPFLAIEPGHESPLGLRQQDVALLATGFVESNRKTGVRSRFHEALHAVTGSLLRYGDTKIRSLVENNRASGGAFSDVLEDLLLARLPNQDRDHYVASRPLPIIRVRNVSITLSSNPGGKTFATLFKNERKRKIRVLDDLTFDAFSGDIVGIIGKNGAGKSTFLKSLVGAIPIATGCIEIEDRPVLLRPGAGMQPDLTGRQNIYKTGLYMNMTMQEIGAMIEDVIDFSELQDHIDRPFKYYSDGMRARLIFSMATAMPRDILLLDELLSAGDLGFQERAMERLNRFLSHAKLVFVVQHTFDFVLTRCTKCLLLDRGVPIYVGEPRIATELYKELL